MKSATEMRTITKTAIDKRKVYISSFIPAHFDAVKLIIEEAAKTGRYEITYYIRPIGKEETIDTLSEIAHEISIQLIRFGYQANLDTFGNIRISWAPRVYE